MLCNVNVSVSWAAAASSCLSAHACTKRGSSIFRAREGLGRAWRGYPCPRCLFGRVCGLLLLLQNGLLLMQLLGAVFRHEGRLPVQSRHGHVCASWPGTHWHATHPDAISGSGQAPKTAMWHLPDALAIPAFIGMLGNRDKRPQIPPLP